MTIGGFLLRLALAFGVWLLALGQASLGDVVVGLILSAGLLLLFGRPMLPQSRSGPSVGRRLLAAVPFLGAVFWDVTVATWDVALVVLGRRPAQPGYVEVPIGERTPIGVAVTTLITTLVPGSVLIDVDWRRGVMLFHVLDAAVPETFQDSLARFYERYQRAVFP